MNPLPPISGRECIRALERAGFRIARQTGSHVIVRRDDPFAQVSVPDHKTLDRGTLRGVIRLAGLSVDEFVRLLDA